MFSITGQKKKKGRGQTSTGSGVYNLPALKYRQPLNESTEQRRRFKYNHNFVITVRCIFLDNVKKITTQWNQSKLWEVFRFKFEGFSQTIPR